MAKGDVKGEWDGRGQGDPGGDRAGATGHKPSASSSLSRQLLFLHLESCGEALASGCGSYGWLMWRWTSPQKKKQRPTCRANLQPASRCDSRSGGPGIPGSWGLLAGRGLGWYDDGLAR